MMCLQRLTAMAVLSALSCGAGSGAAAATPSAQVSHLCDKQAQVVVLYDNSAREPGRAVAWVHDGTQTHRLPLVRTASGARYTDGLWSWWGKGGEARLERQGKPAITGCRAEQAQRVLIDRRTRTQWRLPPAWTEERVSETLLQGSAAEAEQPGAQLLARYSTRPAAEAGAQHTLAQLMVFDTTAWEALQAQHQQQAGAAAPGELVLRTPTWSYVMSLPATPPPSSPAAPDAAASTNEAQGTATAPSPAQNGHKQEHELQAASESLRTGLQLWGRGPQLETCHVRGRVSYRERMALLPGDELQVQLLDTSETPPKVLAEQQRAVGKNQVPLRFELPCGEAQPPFEAGERFVVTARIVRDGRPLFGTEKPAPVLTRDHGHEAELVLSRMRDKPARPSREKSR